MKKLIIKEPEKAITLKEIEGVEKQLNINLPEDYKKHLLQYNGGHPIKDGYPLIEGIDGDEYDQAEIAWFYAIYDGYNNNFLNVYKVLKISEKRVPEELVPIGCGSGGGKICISVKGENYGKVYFWDHNWESEEGEEPDYSNISLIANSFTDFINSLYEFDVLRDENDDRVSILKHDKHSLPFYVAIKKHGDVMKDFFDEAPEEVEEYVIEKHLGKKKFVLKYKVNSTGKSYEKSFNYG